MVPQRALAKSPSLADAIEENYPKLIRWAGQITRHDQPASEDLVQNLFLKSLLAKDQAVEVENIDSYLYRALRNAHISSLRRETLRSETPLADDPFANLEQLSIDPRDSLRIRELLSEICYFACVRKDSSLSACILLLRYFHGYFTAEVVRLLKRPRNSIEARLADARRELKSVIVSDNRVTPARISRFAPVTLRRRDPKGTDDLLHDLRDQIFSCGSGRCLTFEQYRRMYSKQHLKPTREEVGHLVSCRACLESVNLLLKMPQLEDRHPLDTRGPQSSLDYYDHHRAKETVEFKSKY